jgi:hypothetical protein
MQGVIYEYIIGGKYYVGKTYMKERKRINKHKYEALTLKKAHPFCRAIRKYGWEKARKSYRVIEIIETDTKQELNQKLIEREEYWIKERNSVVPNGYNIYKNGQEKIPYTVNKEEIYRRVSNSLKGKYLNHPSTSRKVYCIEQKKWYLSISEAERVNGIARGSIGKAASGVNVTSGGLTWSYDGKYHNRIDELKAKRKPIICVETGQIYPSVYAAAQSIFGEKEGRFKKCRIQASIRAGWAVDGLHYKTLDK